MNTGTKLPGDVNSAWLEAMYRQRDEYAALLAAAKAVLEFNRPQGWTVSNPLAQLRAAVEEIESKR